MCESWQKLKCVQFQTGAYAGSNYQWAIWVSFLGFHYKINTFCILLEIQIRLAPMLCSNFFFFLRKISPELTSATNPPLFAEEDWPWANVYAHLPLLHIWDTYHSMAFAKGCHVHTPDLNQRALGRREAEHGNLTTAPLVQPSNALL